MIRVSGFRFRVSGFGTGSLGFRNSVFGFWVSGLGIWCKGFEGDLKGASAPGPSTEDERVNRTAVDTALEKTQGQIDGFFSQLSFKCYLPEVASVRD